MYIQGKKSFFYVQRFTTCFSSRAGNNLGKNKITKPEQFILQPRLASASRSRIPSHTKRPVGIWGLIWHSLDSCCSSRWAFFRQMPHIMGNETKAHYKSSFHVSLDELWQSPRRQFPCHATKLSLCCWLLRIAQLMLGFSCFTIGLIQRQELRTNCGTVHYKGYNSASYPHILSIQLLVYKPQ